jgi:hypothetical protein
VKRIQDAGQPREEGRDAEGRRLVLLDVVSGEADPQLVFADPAQHLAELAPRDRRERDEGQGQDSEREVVEAHLVVERQAEHGRGHHPGQSIVARGEPAGVGEHDEIERLRAGERDEEDGHRAHPRGQEPDAEPDQHGGGEGQEHDGGREGHAPADDEDPRRIGARAEEGGVAEREHPDIAVQEVPGHRVEPEDHHLHDHVLDVGRVARARERDGQRQHRDRERRDERAGSHRSFT